MWQSVLKGDPTDWLLERSNPSVRYRTLTQILEQPESSPEVAQARAEIMTSGVVPRILERLDGDSWNEEGRFYRDKYTGTVWQLIVLAEHWAHGSDPRIHAACEYLLDHAQDRESFG